MTIRTPVQIAISSQIYLRSGKFGHSLRPLVTICTRVQIAISSRIYLRSGKFRQSHRLLDTIGTRVQTAISSRIYLKSGKFRQSHWDYVPFRSVRPSVCLMIIYNIYAGWPAGPARS